MTCIIGLIDGGTIWMAGDSASSVGKRLMIKAQSKVFCRIVAGTEWFFGCAGSARLSQVLEYELELPTKKAPTGKALLPFMVRELIPLLRKCLERGRCLEKKDSMEQMIGVILIAVNSHLFRIDSEFCVHETKEKFATIGSGQDVAFGVLYATEHLKPAARLRLALRAAEVTTTDIQAPFHIIHSK